MITMITMIALVSNIRKKLYSQINKNNSLILKIQKNIFKY